MRGEVPGPNEAPPKRRHFCPTPPRMGKYERPTYPVQRGRGRNARFLVPPSFKEGRYEWEPASAGAQCVY